LIDVGPVMDLVEGTNAKIGSWSPDNSKFAYIFTGAPNTANVLRVLERDTTTPLYSSDSGGGLSSPSWSPDGKRIAFVKMSADKSAWYIIIVNADGSRCTSDRFECLIRQVPGEQYRGGLAWSKQGLLAVGFNTTGANEVHAVYSDGSGSQNLTNHEADDGSPAWSPDGKQIAFTSTRDGAPQIYVMNADGSGVRRVSQSNVPDFQPAWSPDGNWIAFSSTRNNQTNVYIMDLRGGNVTQLTKNGGDHPTWSH
jgi:TolB protein